MPLDRPSLRRLARAFAWLGAIALAGCASDPVVLQAAPAAPTARFDRPIAFFHSAGFRDRQETVEPYGNKYYLPLKVGEASDRALRATYRQMFTDAREVPSREAAAGGSAGSVAVLEPSITRLKYLNASRRMEGPYYAEIDYRFRLSEPGGATLAEWTARGVARYSMADPVPRKDARFPSGEQAILVEAPRRAIEEAVEAFARSFERVPELIRWTRGEIATEANAPSSGLVMQGTLSSTGAVDASYPGVLALRIERTALPRPAKTVVEQDADPPRLVALRVTLRNDSGRRLALDPADIEWIGQGGATMEPLPPVVAGALATLPPLSLSVTPGIGVVAVVGLFAGLISAAEMSRYQSQYAAWSTALTTEMLVDGVAGAGETRSGLVYFQRPETPDGTLVVRVIDRDAALRYTVRIPVVKG